MVDVDANYEVLSEEEREVFVVRIHNWLRANTRKTRGPLAEAASWAMKTRKFQLTMEEGGNLIANVSFGVRFGTFDWYVRWLKVLKQAQELQQEAEEVVEEEEEDY